MKGTIIPNAQIARACRALEDCFYAGLNVFVNVHGLVDLGTVHKEQQIKASPSAASLQFIAHNSEVIKYVLNRKL